MPHGAFAYVGSEIRIEYVKSTCPDRRSKLSEQDERSASGYISKQAGFEYINRDNTCERKNKSKAQPNGNLYV